MAVLTEAQRAEVLAQYMNWASNDGGELHLTKADLLAAVDSTDEWLDDNAAAYNNALPATAKAELSQHQKTYLLHYVAVQRAEVS